MASFTIRYAEPKDADDLVRLINSLAKYEKLEDQSKPDAEVLKKQLGLDAQPRIEALVAHDKKSGRCVGFALFFPNYSTFLTNFGLFLEDLFVEPEYRGLGIGLALFKRLVTIAEDRGCQRMDWNVLDWNEMAIKFYEQLGAVALTDWQTMRLDKATLSALSSS